MSEIRRVRQTCRRINAVEHDYCALAPEILITSRHSGRSCAAFGVACSGVLDRMRAPAT